MKAHCLRRTHDISVENGEEPRIEKPTDVVVRMVSTNICGTGWHMYEDRIDFEQGRVIGCENQGEVAEVGND